MTYLNKPHDFSELKLLRDVQKLQDNLDKKIWKNRKGFPIPIDSMSYDHLLNCVEFLNRKLDFWHQHPNGHIIIPILEQYIQVFVDRLEALDEQDTR